MCIYRKKTVYIGFGTIHGSGNPLGSWNMSPMDKEGQLHI